MKKLLLILTLMFAASSYAATSSTLTCGSDDLSGVSFIKCAGYDVGNLLSNSSSDLSQVKSIFTNLGFSDVSTTWEEKITNLNGSSTIDFTKTLNGVNIIGIFKGSAGDGSQGTAFYVVDAGTNLDKFKYNLSGSSSATIYSVASPVSEPSTYALFLAGLCTVVWVGKRRIK